MDQFFVRWRGKVSGPYSRAQIIQMAKGGQLTRHHAVSSDMANWQPAAELPWVFTVPAQNEAPSSETKASATSETLHTPQPPTPLRQEWYYSQAGKPQIGPVTFAILQQLSIAGQLHATDQVWSEGSPSWIPAAQVPGLVFSTPSPSVPEREPRSTERRQVLQHMSKFCEACGESISLTAKACPSCGHMGIASSSSNALGHLALALAVASTLFFPPFLGLAAFICAIVFLVQTKSKGYGVIVLLLSIFCPIIGIVLGVVLSS